MGRPFGDRVADRVNGLGKDLVVVTDDIITGVVNGFWKRWLPGGSDDHPATAVQALGRLGRTPRLAVLGNHDHNEARSRPSPVGISAI